MTFFNLLELIKYKKNKYNIYIYIKEIVLFYFIEYLPSKPKINILTSFDPQRRFNKDENI